MNTIVVDNPIWCCTNTLVRETHFQFGLNAGWVWLTKLRHCSAAAGEHENRFYDLLRSRVGAGPLTAHTHFRIYVNDIKHFEMHKIAPGQHFLWISENYNIWYQRKISISSKASTIKEIPRPDWASIWWILCCSETYLNPLNNMPCQNLLSMDRWENPFRLGVAKRKGYFTPSIKYYCALTNATACTPSKISSFTSYTAIIWT